MSETTRVEIPAEETGPNAPPQDQNQGGAGDRPEWLPQKFNSPEQLAQAYSELEKKLGGGDKSQSGDENQDSADDNRQTPQASVDQAKDQLERAGLDFSEFQQEWEQNGQLSDDSYQKLEQSGFSRDFVDSWVAGQQALADRTANEVFELTGGQDNYQQMAEWASQNLSADELQAFNETIEKGTVGATKMAVAGLYARYTGANGSEPSMISGEAPGAATGYQSRAQMTQDMRDPRYKTDPAFRQEVERKIANSNIF